jgi:hypothetical protein
MSEQILERPAAAPTSPEAPKSPKRSSRMFLIVGGAVIAGLILGGAFLMLRPTSDPLADALVPAVPVAAAAGAQEGQPNADPAAAEADPGAAGADEAAEEGATKPAGPNRVRLTSRDPFAPIVAKAAPAPEKAAADAKAAEPAAAPKPATGGVISALSISPLGNSVKLKLDGKKYSVDEGEAFAKSYRLYDIFNANCAGFLYGDQNAVVCEGDSVTIG